MSITIPGGSLSIEPVVFDDFRWNTTRLHTERWPVTQSRGGENNCWGDEFNYTHV